MNSVEAEKISMEMHHDHANLNHRLGIKRGCTLSSVGNGRAKAGSVQQRMDRADIKIGHDRCRQ